MQRCQEMLDGRKGLTTGATTLCHRLQGSKRACNKRLLVLIYTRLVFLPKYFEYFSRQGQFHFLASLLSHVVGLRAKLYGSREAQVDLPSI